MAFQLQKLQSPYFEQAGVDADALSERIDRFLTNDARRLTRLWAYYRNPMTACGETSETGDRPYRQAQEWGLPARITGVQRGASLESASAVAGVARKEVVIENDIAWRVDTMIDYLFGQSIVIDSTAVDPDRRAVIGQLLRLILASNGGIALLQQIALMGAVYGYVDILVKLCPGATHDTQSPIDAQGEPATTPCSTQPLGQPARSSVHQSSRESGSSARAPVASLNPFDADHPSPATVPPHAESASSDAPAFPAETGDRSDESPSPDDASRPGGVCFPTDATLQRLARFIRVEVVEPTRALPLLSPRDYRSVEAFVQVSTLASPTPARSSRLPLHGGWWGRFFRARDGRFASHASDAPRNAFASANAPMQLVEIITPSAWQRYENQTLVASGQNTLGKLPLIHIQNSALPFEYSGASDVEALIPLQDELNTRLSDRAHRITMQSFKMYLGKGIDNFNEMPVAPGRMWATDNSQADVIEFGGDAHSPSEESHIAEVREALDKTSGVTPIAAGAIKGRIGRLTSAAALRVTMQALLAKTEKKRTTYGAGISQICTLALEWLDRAGLFPTSPGERQIEIHWPHPIPANEGEKLQEAEAKVRLGIPHEIILRELGY